MKTLKRKPGPPPRPAFDGAALYRQRLRLGVTQREIGEACGVSSSCVNRWERGIAKPHVRVRKKIAEVLREAERAL